MNKRPSPTLAELAQIAGTLSKNSNGDDFGGLARRSLEVWTACNNELEREARMAAMVGELHDELGRIEDSIPKPKSGFPAPFDDFLKALVGRGSETKNLPEFKAFLSDWLHRQAAHQQGATLDSTTPPSIDAIEAVLVQLRAAGLTEDEWLMYARDYARFAARKRSEHAKLAASKPRPNRKSRKKVLGSDSA